VAALPEPVHSQEGLIRFGGFQLDPQAGELCRNGTKHRLQGQPLELLTLLLQHSGQVVTREQIQRHLWPDGTVVEFEHSVNAAVKRLRIALEDDADHPTFIETIPRRGYRFLMPVNGATADAAPTPHPVPSSKRWPVLVGGALLVAGVALGWTIRHWQHHPVEMKQRRLTANAQELPVLGSVISPDGKYLAFADKTGFYLRQIDNNETHPVSFPQGFNAIPVSWYPDGTHLVATWIESPETSSSLWQISILGGAPRKLIDDGRCASVSGDGLQIAFVRGLNPDEELWVMGGNGEKPRRLLAAAKMSIFGVPAWSPDAKRLAYVNGSYEPAQWGVKTNITTLDVSTGRPEVIVSPPNTELNQDVQLGPGLAWTLDNHVLYSVTEQRANQHESSLWSLPVDSRGHATGRATRLTDAPDDVSHLTASADGKRIVFTKDSFNAAVYLSEVQSPGPQLTTPQRLTVDDWNDIPFGWTPDSQAVVFVSDRDGPYHVFKQGIDQTVAELLVGGNEQATVPRLAADNSTLLYVVWPKLSDSNTPTRLMKTSLAGGSPQTVLQQKGLGNVQCARPPSTLCIYHVGTAKKLSFFRFDHATGTSEELPQLRIEDQAAHTYNWSLSPDGTNLATVKDLGVQKDPSIDLRSIRDGSKRTITARAWVGMRGIDFAADGRSLWAPVYTNSGKSALLNIDLNGHTRKVLEDSEMRIDWAVPSPDGKYLALLKFSGSSNVWMLE
jgi:DNA-binding winged helix-turn-helix (wHTH) protein/Tol biopolymer transport system component